MSPRKRNSKRKTTSDESIVPKSKRTKSKVNANAGDSKDSSTKQQIVVKASSHNYKLRYRKGAEGISSGSFQSNKKLVELNDDCLDNIWKYLDFNDRINLQFASDRFSDLTGAYLEREEFQFGDFKKKFSLAQAESLLSQFGFCIKRLTHNYIDCYDWANKFKPYNDLLPKYCPNIEELDIGYKQTTNYFDDELLITLKKKLKVLKAACCDLTDKQCSIIGKLTGLEFLELQVNSKITGKYLMNFRKLKHLNISCCRQFQSENFNKLCRNNRFENLNIDGCNLLNQQSFTILLQTQSDCLRELNVSYFYDKADVTVLTKLKSLRIVKINSRFDDEVRNGQDIIQELARLHGDDLESLELCLGSDYEFSNKDLANILKFKTLKKIHIFAIALDKEFVYKLTKSCPNLEDLAVNVRKEVTQKVMMDIISRFTKLKCCSMYYPREPRWFW